MLDHLKSKEIVVNQGSLPWIENTKHTVTTLFECGRTSRRRLRSAPEQDAPSTSARRSHQHRLVKEQTLPRKKSRRARTGREIRGKCRCFTSFFLETNALFQLERW